MKTVKRNGRILKKLSNRELRTLRDYILDKRAELNEDETAIKLELLNRKPTKGES